MQLSPVKVSGFSGFIDSGSQMTEEKAAYNKGEIYENKTCLNRNTCYHEFMLYCNP